MRKYLLLLFFLTGFCFTAFSQGTKSSFLQNIDLKTIKPEDIPDAEQLKAMGATDEEIKILQDIKNNKGATLPDQTSKPRASEADSSKKLLKNRPDTLYKTSTYDTLLKLPPVTIYGQEFFRNRNLGLFNRSESSRAPDNYILSSGDKLNISVWGYSDYNESFILDKEGYIQSRDAGRIYLKGLNFSDARLLLEKRFGSFLDLKNSRIDVSLAGSRTITVNIVGEVNSPGSYTIPAINTAFNALIMANGTNSIGSVRKIYVRRGGKLIKTLDVYTFLLNPDSNEDFFLENNDYILVPPAEKVVNVKGEIRRPNSYELVDKDGILDVIKYCGGVKSTGLTASVLVKRISKGKTFYEDVNLDSLAILKTNFAMMDGDTVLVKPIPDFPEGYVEIAGSVRVPGRYEHIQGEKISGLIKRARGVMDETYLPRAYLVHQKEDMSKEYFSFDLKEILENENSQQNKVIEPYDMVAVFSKKRFSDPDSIYLFGSVRKPGHYLFGTGLKVKDVIYLAGGFRKEAANNKIEISRLSNIGKGSQDSSRVIVLSARIGYDMSLSQDAQDFELQPFDQIFVRRIANFDYQQNIQIQGEVLYPGVYSLSNKNERLFEMIGRAGGLTDWAFPEGTKLFRNQDSLGFLFLNFNKKELTDLSLPSNYVLKEGDSIFIPKINELVAVQGAVNYPGIDTIKQINVPYFKHRHALYYINNYGVGFAKGAKKRKTYVIQPGGFIKRTIALGFMNLYPKVAKGSTIVAVYRKTKKEKEKKQSEPINWNKVIENTTVKITGVLTLYLLITQLKKL